MLNGTFQVLFKDSYYTPNERPELLTAMVDFAAECAPDENYWPVFKAIQAKYNQVLGPLKFEDTLDTISFNFFAEGPGWSTFDMALSMFSRRLDFAQIELNETMLTILREFYEAGLVAFDRFRARYSPFFEQALTDYHLAPDYAWLVACDRAGLPVDEWVRDWPRDFQWLPYHLSEQTKEAA